MAPRAPARNNDVAEDEERETLLPSGLAEPVTSTSSIATHPLESSSSKIQPSPSSEINLCRICLEEDTPDKLISPCSCSGTQKYAHHDCIQRWISEKGPNALRCEVCHSTYSGSFIVPPPAPSSTGQRHHVSHPRSSHWPDPGGHSWTPWDNGDATQRPVPGRREGEE